MKQVAAAIIERDGCILIARRAAGQKLAGCWEFPGGKIEAGEDARSCIVRELKEELGLEVIAGRITAESSYQYGDGAINLIGVSASIVSGGPTLTVHDAVEWVPQLEVLLRGLAPADVPLAEKMLAQAGGCSR